MTLKQLELLETIDIEGAKAGSGKAYKPVRDDDSKATIAYLSVLYGLSEGVVRGFGVNAWTVEELKKSVYLDGTPIMSQDGTILHEDVEVDFRYGTIDQTPIEGMPSVTIESVVGVEVRAGTPVTRNFLRKEANSYDVRISIPRLMQNTNEGDSRKGAVTFAIDVATGTGSFSQYGVYTINEKITQGFQRTYNITIPQAASRSIRVRKITPDGDNTLTFNDITLEAITEVVEVRLAYPHTALLWLKYDARNFSNAPKVEVLLHGIADMQIPMNYNPDTRQYATSGAGTTNGVWNGQFKTGYTDNPAWHWFLMATNKRYSLGNKITESLTNKFYLYSLAKYCDELVPDGKGGQEPRFTCNNLYLQKQEDAFKVMKDLASVFRAKTIWDGMYLTPKMDTPRDAMLVFSRANVNNITYASTSSAAQHNVVAVQFYDTDNHYDTKFAYARSVENIRQRGRIEQIEVTALGCTSEGQAQRYADYLLNTELLETELISFTTGLDGMRPVVGDVFVFADDLVAGKATSGRVVSVAGDKVVVDRDLNIALDVGGTFIANTTETLASTRTITAIAADKRTVTLSSAINVVDITGLVWAVKSSNVGLREYTVDDVSYDADTFTFAVTGIKYARGKYSSADNAAHIVNPPLTIIEPLLPRQPDIVTAKYYVVVEQGMNLSNIEAAWSQVTSAAKYELEMRRDGGEWRKLGETQSLTYTVENAYAGVYEFRVRSFDVVGNASMYRVSAPLLVQGKILPPPMLEQLTVKGELFAIRADWVYPAASEDSLSVVIEINTEDPTVSTVNKTTMEVAYPATSFTFTGLSAHARLWLRAAIKDRYGNVGAFTVWTDATADSNPSAILDIIEGEINAGTLDQALRDKIEIGTGAAETAALAQLAAEAASQAAINASSASALAQVSADDAKTAASSASNAVAVEAATRREAVIALNDGLTQETNARTDGDATLFSNINTYKTSNDNALASVRNQTTVNTDALSSQAEQLTQLDAGLTDTAQLLSSNIVRVNDIDGKVESHAEQLTNINASLQGKADANVLNSLSSTVTEIDGKVVANTQELSAQSTRLANAELGVTNNASAISKTYTKTEADDVIAGKVESYDASLVIGGTNLMEYTSGNAAIYGAGLTYDAVTNSFIKPSGAIYYTAFRLDSFKPKMGEVYTVSGYLYVDDQPANYSNYWTEHSTINSFQKSIGKVHIKSDGHFYGTYEVTDISEWSASHFFYPAATLLDESLHTLRFKDLQLEKGSKPSAYSTPTYETQKSLRANANAIQTVTAEVARVNGEVVSTANSVSNLSSNVGLLQGSINEVRQTVTNNQESTNILVTSLRSGMADADDVSMMMRNATVLFEDLTFRDGYNGVTIYNHQANGALACNFTDKLPDNPVAATRQLQFIHSGGATEPSLGGYYQITWSRPNGVFLLKFVAKLPVGFSFDLAANAYGDGATCYFIGGNAGTGKFKTYYAVYRCGATGSFSAISYVYVNGQHPTTENPLIWYLASSTVYDCLDSKIAPDSVVNGIAEAKSTASTAVNKSEATALIAQNLQASLDNTNATISTQYYTKADTLSAITSASNQLSSSFDTSIKNVGVIKDTRNDNQPPSWYWTNHPHKVEKEFKYSYSIGATVDTLGVLETTVPWSDSSGGAIQQKFTWADSADALTRYSISQNEWSVWASVLNDVKNAVNRKLDASIISNYYTKAEADNVVAGKIEKFSSTVLTSGENLFKGDILNVEKAYASGVSGFNYTDYWVIDAASGNGNYISLSLGVSPQIINKNGLYQGAVTVSMDYMVESGSSEALPFMHFGHGYQAFLHAQDGLHLHGKWYRIYTTFYTDAYFLLSEPHFGVGHIAGRICIRNLKIERGSMTTYSADIKETTKSINGIEAVKTVTIDNNGVMSGYGLISQLKNGQVTSAFGVNASTFFIGAPASGKKPFIVLADTGTINGVVVPAGTYIDTAFIADLTVTSAKIADLGVTNAKIANLAVDGAKIANLAVDSAKIANAAITNAKIGDLQVNTLKLAYGSVTTGTLINSSWTDTSNFVVTNPAGKRILSWVTISGFAAVYGSGSYAEIWLMRGDAELKYIKFAASYKAVAAVHPDSYNQMIATALLGVDASAFFMHMDEPLGTANINYWVKMRTYANSQSDHNLMQNNLRAQWMLIEAKR